eukprot:1141149-Pelagomonas_calceolata.AAC.4
MGRLLDRLAEEGQCMLCCLSDSSFSFQCRLLFASGGGSAANGGGAVQALVPSDSSLAPQVGLLAISRVGQFRMPIPYARISNAKNSIHLPYNTYRYV